MNNNGAMMFYIKKKIKTMSLLNVESSAKIDYFCIGIYRPTYSVIIFTFVFYFQYKISILNVTIICDKLRFLK